MKTSTTILQKNYENSPLPIIRVLCLLLHIITFKKEKKLFEDFYYLYSTHE